MLLRSILAIAAASSLSSTGVALADTADSVLVEGRFGSAVDGADAPRVDARDEYSRPPLTVECWARLRTKGGFNILMADEPKESGDHWEIYSYAGSGFFSAYLPGYEPAENVSSSDIADERWHHVLMAFDGSRVRLDVDGKVVLENAVKRRAGAGRVRGPLTIGLALAGTGPIGCDGTVDEVRVSRTFRPPAPAPGAPLVPDAGTIGLWHLDEAGERGASPDASPLTNPARLDPRARTSLDEIDRESFKAGPSPLDSPARDVALEAGAGETAEGPPSLSLDGDWEMARGGEEAARLAGPWPDAVPVRVPGSVHAALVKAGKLPDPKFGRNDAAAHAASFETWWLRRTFPRPPGAGCRLVFGGVAIHCTVWLNGRRLGEHEGMFGGPEFDVAALLEEKNVLAVRIDPAPGDPKAWNDPDWRKTVVFNNVWGWHYSSIPALGIWRPVRIEAAPAVRLEPPLVATRDAAKGTVDLVLDLSGPAAGWTGEVRGSIRPETFAGEPRRFAVPLSGAGARREHLRFSLPDPHPWWPNGLGRPDLYRLRVSFSPAGGGVADARETTFGLRTVRMDPFPQGPRPNLYNWTFVVNGRPTFVKGTGWCTMDSSLDFSRERYDRFLSLARLQNVQMLRAWGSGMPETDEFYDLCDRKGLLVLQEWPTAWDSHLVQPRDVLEETVRLNTVRLRNHPSLAMYGAGNESGNPFGEAIDRMGRLAIELDGTRPFHRGEPWGGSAHNYDCYWGWQPLDRNLSLTAPFFGEFGLACMPVLESVLRYLPAEERDLWPPPPDGSLAHHTPIFNTAEDLKRLLQYARPFTGANDLASFIVGSQLSQAVGVRHTLELARTRWPRSTGALYYKLNDNYPAASWSSVDWYGAPKIGHSFFADAFAPLHAAVLFPSLDLRGKPASLAVFLLDDADALAGSAWTVGVRAYDVGLRRIAERRFAGSGGIDRVRRLGELALEAGAASSVPILVVAEVAVGGTITDRTFYFANHETSPGCLFRLPRTRLTLDVRDGKAVVRNEGPAPAVAAEVARPGHRDSFTVEDSHFWMEPGESRALAVSESDGLAAGAWNADEVTAPPASASGADRAGARAGEAACLRLEEEWTREDAASRARTKEPPFSTAQARRAIDRARALAGRVASLGGDPAALRALRESLEDLAAKTAAAERAGSGEEARRALFLEARRLARAVAFRNPLLAIDRLLFIERRDAGGVFHMCDQYYGFNARPGGGLFVLEDPCGPRPRVVDLLRDSTLESGRRSGLRLEGGAFLSPEVSFDGETVLFAWTEAKGKPTETPDESSWSPGTSYHLFSVRSDGSHLRQLTDGPWDDFDPCALPGGRVAFVSERRGGFLRCGRYCPVYTLHTMAPDGTDVSPLSFHETHEWHPSVTNDGMLLYTRWDYVDRDTNIAHHPWTCFPDGRNPRAVLGNYPLRREARPWMVMSVRAVPGSHLLVGTAAAHHGHAFGSLVLIDPRIPDDGALAAMARLTPEVLFPEAEAKDIARGMVYGTPWPLGEDDFLCVRGEPGETRGIYWIDRQGNREILHRDPAISCLSPIPLRPRPRPPVLPEMAGRLAGPLRGGGRIEDHDPPRPPAIDPPADAVATVAVTNVYDADFRWPEGTRISALRVIGLLPKTTAAPNLPRVGVAEQTNARAVLGTTRVEEDGSAHFIVPAGRPVYFQALDERGLAVQSMRSVTYFQPGEQAVCRGCHEPRSTTPAGGRSLPLALRRPPERLAPPPDGADPFSFPRLVQPALDRGCVPCHVERKALDLRGGVAPDGRTRSYDALAGKYGFYFHVANGAIDTGVHGGSRTVPGAFGARAAPLIRYLGESHHGVHLPPEDFARIALWLDCNSEFLGAYEDAPAQARGEVVRPSLE